MFPPFLRQKLAELGGHLRANINVAIEFIKLASEDPETKETSIQDICTHHVPTHVINVTAANIEEAIDTWMDEVDRTVDNMLNNGSVGLKKYLLSQKYVKR